MTQPPPPPSAQQDTQLALAAAEALSAAVTVAGALGVIGPAAAAAGIGPLAISGALSVVMAMPGDRAGFYGPATHTIARVNLARKAQFVVASSRRLQADVIRGRSEDQPLYSVLADAITRERRFYGQHLIAGWGRENAAARVDSASMSYGRLLGWYSVHDPRTSPECRAADRHNFYADQMPAIGYPGMVHPHCRCMPGMPVDGAPMVGSNRPVRRRVPVAA